MAKDPAFLFYPGDWLGGTLGMTLEEKGAYMEVLMLQFNRGHMEGHMCAQVVGQLWDKIQHKFKQDEKGLWYNERLEIEKNNRKSFTDSRKNNLKGTNQHTNKTGHKKGHMTSHMENEDENENIDTINIHYSEKFKKVWSKWKQYRLEQHQTVYKGLQSEDMALMNLNELSRNNEDAAIEIINYTISNTWKNFIVPKSQKKSINSQPQFDPIKK